MENTKLFLENGAETEVKGILYLYNSKYYFMYTLGEPVDETYTQLYIVQVCKEMKNTESGQEETGYILGLEITDSNEWSKVQESITKIVEEKKSGVHDSGIQYVPITMLKNFKIVSKNKFKLMNSLLQDHFKLTLQNTNVSNTTEQAAGQPNSEENDVIIDYRAKFFEEQDKNQELQEKIKGLEEKLTNIKQILE